MHAWIIAEGTSWIGPALGALVVGLIGGWVVKTFLDNQKRAGAKNEAESIIKEAESRKNEILGFLKQPLNDLCISSEFRCYGCRWNGGRCGGCVCGRYDAPLSAAHSPYDWCR